jgi:predicted DNA binding CopG/RHH family protein
MPEELTKRITIRVTENLHRATKAKAAKEGLTLQNAITALLKEWLKDESNENSSSLQD